MIQQAIQKIVDGLHLTEQEAAAAMNVIMDGEATPAQIGAFITALRIKGETVDEIVGCARAMREKANRISTGRDAPRRYLRHRGRRSKYVQHIDDSCIRRRRLLAPLSPNTAIAPSRAAAAAPTSSKLSASASIFRLKLSGSVSSKWASVFSSLPNSTRA